MHLNAGLLLAFALAPFWLILVAKKGHQSMTKTLDLISDVIKNPKHPFRQVDDRPEKPQKHRYELRKVKEFIRVADWMSENQAAT